MTPRRERILVTRVDGGVTIIIPSARCVWFLQHGGRIACVGHAPELGIERWGLSEWLRDKADAQTIEASQRTGYLPLGLARAWEIEKLVRDPGWRPDRPDREAFASQWIDGLMHGGLGEGEAVALIGEYSRPPFSTALEIVDVSEIPEDRTYRDAWRRSANGGPIWIDDAQAQAIDEARMWASYQGRAA